MSAIDFESTPRKPACWLAQFSDAPCTRPLVRCHLFAQHKLRKEFPEGALWLEGRPVAVSADAWERGQIVVVFAAVKPVVVLRRSLRQLCEDERLWIWGCGSADNGHHGDFDGYRLKVPFSMVPPATLRFVALLGMTGKLENDRRYQHNR